jgi:hypothetical protein
LPNFMAHRICAGITLQRLEGSPAAEIIRRHPASYILGSQGADILYYRLTQLLRGRRGMVYHARMLHGQPIAKLAAMGGQYLEKAAGKRQFEDAFSYVCGFLCHHAVDQQVHSLIDTKQVGLLRHRHIELDLDAFMSRYLGIEPDKRPAGRRSAKGIAGFASLVQWYNFVFSGLFSRQFSRRAYARGYRAMRRASLFLDRPGLVEKRKTIDKPMLPMRESRALLAAALHGAWSAADIIGKMCCALELGAQLQARESILAGEPA